MEQFRNIFAEGAAKLSVLTVFYIVAFFIVIFPLVLILLVIALNTGTLPETADSRWLLQADLSGDGAFSISDIWLWIKWIIFIPGDAIVFSMLDNSVGNFFEVSPKSYGGIFSFLASAYLWYCLELLVGSIFLRDKQPDTSA